MEVRLVDLEGSPLAGALARLTASILLGGRRELASELLSHDFLPPLVQKWTSDRDGRFAVRGYGPDHNRSSSYPRVRVRQPEIAACNQGRRPHRRLSHSAGATSSKAV